MFLDRKIGLSRNFVVGAPDARRSWATVLAQREHLHGPHAPLRNQSKKSTYDGGSLGLVVIIRLPRHLALVAENGQQNAPLFNFTFLRAVDGDCKNSKLLTRKITPMGGDEEEEEADVPAAFPNVLKSTVRPNSSRACVELGHQPKEYKVHVVRLRQSRLI